MSHYCSRMKTPTCLRYSTCRKNLKDGEYLQRKSKTYIRRGQFRGKKKKKVERTEDASHYFASSTSSSPSTLTRFPCTFFSTSGTRLSRSSKSLRPCQSAPGTPWQLTYRPTKVTVFRDFSHRG